MRVRAVENNFSWNTYGNSRDCIAPPVMILLSRVITIFAAVILYRG
jgi:hypothetical protein